MVDPGPYFLLGRLLSVAMGTASVYLVYRLGRDAFGRPAGLLAALFLAVAPLHVAYSHMAVTDVTAVAFSLLALVLLQRAAGRAPGTAPTATATGSTGSPLARGRAPRRPLARARRGRRRPRHVDQVQPRRCSCCRRPSRPSTRAAPRPPRASPPAAAPSSSGCGCSSCGVYLPMAVAFVVASPFVVLDAPHFLRDFRRQSQIMDRGWLGFEHVGNGFWFNVTPNLTGAIGVVLVVLGVAGLGWALWRRTRLDLMVAPYVIVYFVYISTWKELADRYLLVIVPLLLLLAVRLCVERRRAWRGRGSGASRCRWSRSCSPWPSSCRSSSSVAFDRDAQRHRHARAWPGSGSSATCRRGR